MAGEPLTSNQLRWRYRIQQDKGEYCLKQCADGDLVDYAEASAIIERLTAVREQIALIAREHPCRHTEDDSVPWCACCRVRKALAGAADETTGEQK